MTAQDSLISYIQTLSIDDEKFKDLKVVLEEHLRPKSDEEVDQEKFREDVFNQNTKKLSKKNNSTKASSKKHQGPIRINPENPKKMNCKSWTLYESYKKAKSFEEFKQFGGEAKHYNYDLKKGLILELTEEHLKLLSEDPEYNFFKKEDLDENESAKIPKSKKKLTEVKCVPEKSKGLTSKVKETSTKIPVIPKDQDEKNPGDDKEHDESESEGEETKNSLENTKNSKKNNSNKKSLPEESEKEMTSEELNTYLEALLNDIVNMVISHDNFENKRDNITTIKKKLFEDSNIKKNFKKNNKDLNNKISCKYNEKSTVFEIQCKKEFNDVINSETDRDDTSNDETEEIDVCVHEQDGVSYNLDPKTGFIYDDNEIEAKKIGKLRDGVIIFD